MLERFGNGAKLSLFSARHALKQMAKSDKPLDVLKHLSLGSEYACAWLMRRLFAKPLEENRTAGDMYRNYVSKVVSAPMLDLTYRDYTSLEAISGV